MLSLPTPGNRFLAHYSTDPPAVPTQHRGHYRLYFSTGRAQSADLFSSNSIIPEIGFPISQQHRFCPIAGRNRGLLGLAGEGKRPGRSRLHRGSSSKSGLGSAEINSRPIPSIAGASRRSYTVPVAAESSETWWAASEPHRQFKLLSLSAESL